MRDDARDWQDDAARVSLPALHKVLGAFARSGGQPRARILLKASTESEWVAQHLESLDHEVIVADPSYAPMYANRSRRTKTDKHGARTRYIALAKALVRRDGLRVPTSASAWAPTRITELDLSPALTTELTPLFAVYASLNEQIAAADRRIAAVAASDPIVARLATPPGIGPVTTAFVATIDEITRFRSAHQLEAYLGVVPSERSSGEKRQLKRITKADNGRMRWLLVEAAWRILRSKSPDTAAVGAAFRLRPPRPRCEWTPSRSAS